MDQPSIANEIQLAATVFEASREAIFITDAKGRILRVNSAFVQYTRYREPDILGRHASVLIDEETRDTLFAQVISAIEVNGSWRGECFYRQRKGVASPCLVSVSAINGSGSDLSHYVVIFMDISEKKANEERIRRLAYYDALTEIPNRSLFNDRLAKALQYGERRSSAVAVLFLDLDRFKPVNDSLGHSAGDQLLRGVARRLSYCIREEDTVARMGGDEFAIVLADLPIDQEAEKIVIKTAQRIIAQFVAPFLIEGREVFTSTSIGVALFPRDGRLADELLRNADMAMYAAKQSGRNHYQFYDQHMNVKAMERLFIENAMRRALVNQEFQLVFQPQYAVDSLQLTGLEALLRWQHPSFGLLEPAQFVALAEETDLIIPIGEWVFQRVCELLVGWRSRGVKPPRVSLNVSAAQFKRRNFADWLLFQLRVHDVAPSQIMLEITETVLMEDLQHSLTILQDLHDAGITLAIDDFGKGYSSLSYLRRFPVDALKIDRDFVGDIGVSAQGLLSGGDLAATVIAIAHSLRLAVIAEGVEDDAQLTFLREHRCHEVQGYWLGKPLDEVATLDLLQSTPAMVIA